LESSKGPVDVLVIDHVEQPTPDQSNDSKKNPRPSAKR
jgi:hypothetical protein